jgi:hypothetical protein
MVGLDKLQVTTRDFRLQKIDSQHFGIDRSIKQGGADIPILLTTNEMQDIFANKIWHNSELVNLDINRHGLRVQFNPSARYHTYHLTGTGDRLNRVVDDVQTYVDRLGIECSIKDMQISRVDVTAQKEMSQIPSMYYDVFKMFKQKRLKNTKEHPSSYLVGNKQWQTCAYDKLQELKDYKLHSLIEGENNLLRIENRWLQTKEVKRTLPFDTIHKLCDTTNDELQSIYSKHLQNRTFNKNYSSVQMKLDFHEQSEILKQLLKQDGQTYKSAVLSLLHIIGDLDMSDTIMQFGGITKFREFIQENGVSRATSFRIVNDLVEMIKQQEAFRNKQGKVSVVQLYEEILSKFVA